MAIQLHFPLWIIWESKSLGMNLPATFSRNGKSYLALFSHKEAELQYRRQEQPSNSESDKRDEFTAEELKFFLNQYNHVAINPYSESEVMLAATELREHLESLPQAEDHRD